MAGLPQDNDQIVQRLISYRQEADASRKTGVNPRDDKWAENLDLYWNRWDYSDKAAWQAQETMPEVPGFVDRFAGAMKDALVSGGDQMYDIIDPGDSEKDLSQAVRRMTDVWLSRTGYNATGTPMDFSTVFEDQIKLGALMMMSSVVTWRKDVPGGRVAIETVDPREVWLDNTYRNQYRVRRTTIDRHELVDMAKQKDSKGNPIWHLPEINQMVVSMDELFSAQRENLQGSSQGISSTRVPVTLDEYYAVMIDDNGEKTDDRALYVVANDKYLLRGPEDNPYWHKRDWLVTTPLITVPLSVYGRTYMEDFGALAKTFNDLTNLLLDAVFFSSIRAYVAIPDVLKNPEQMAEGIWPGKTYLAEEGIDPRLFAHAIEMGNLPPEAVNLWSSIKSELTEAARINEIGLGQFAPKGRTSAQEIAQTAQSSSAVIKSIAQTVEKRWVDPTIDLVWMTGLQHMSPTDVALQNAAGEDMFGALYARRRELIKRPITFQARGISRLIQRSTQLQALVQLMQIVASNEVLMQAFFAEVDINKLLAMLFTLSDIDVSKLKLSERERMMKEAVQSMQAAGAVGPDGQPVTQQSQPQGPGGPEVAQLARQMGIGRGAPQ